MVDSWIRDSIALCLGGISGGTSGEKKMGLKCVRSSKHPILGNMIFGSHIYTIDFMRTGNGVNLSTPIFDTSFGTSFSLPGSLVSDPLSSTCRFLTTESLVG